MNLGSLTKQNRTDTKNITFELFCWYFDDSLSCAPKSFSACKLDFTICETNAPTMPDGFLTRQIDERWMLTPFQITFVQMNQTVCPNPLCIHQILYNLSKSSTVIKRCKAFKFNVIAWEVPIKPPAIYILFVICFSFKSKCA